MKKGLLISFDGIDSSGKETQSKELARRLRYGGHTVHTLKTPDYTTKSGQRLKKLLQNKDQAWEKLSWPEKMKLFAANRAEHRDEVRRVLKERGIMVYDRYVPSSIAFIATEAVLHEKGVKRNQVHAAVEQHEYTENRMPREDISIFLDVQPAIAETMLTRRKAKQHEGDEYTDHFTVQQQLYNEYDLLHASDPQRYMRIKCVEGTELLGVQDIAELVWEALLVRFPYLEKNK